MYGCENWTIKKAECRRIDAFELWHWRRLLTVPWTVRRSNQPILKEISPEYSLEGLTLKLILQYFGHLMWRTDSFEKTLILERLKAGEGDDRGWDGWMVSPPQWTWIWTSSGSWWWTGKPGVLQSMGSQRVRHDWVTELNWISDDEMEKGDTIDLHCEHYWLQCKLVQILLKKVKWFLKQFKMKVAYDPAISLLNIYPKKTKIVV